MNGRSQPGEGRRPGGAGRPRRGGFTLIELVLVMTLLVVVVAVAAPSLTGFFRGRALDSEARRLLALTRLGQSRAASGGVPMVLWVDPAQHTYGLEEDPSYADQDPRAVEYKLDSKVQVEVVNAVTVKTLMAGGLALASEPPKGKRSALPQIRFLPDGSPEEGSLESVRLSDREGNSLWLALGRSRLGYEIHNHQAEPRAAARR